MSAAEPELHSLPPEPAPPAAWSSTKRILFRILFCYLVLYTSPKVDHSSVLGDLPGGDWITKPYIELWKKIVPWVAIHVFHQGGRAVTYFPSGSGDKTLDHVLVFCYLVVAIGVAVVWSVVDRKRTHYRTLHAWLRVLVRYTLAVTMFSYGFVKVFPLQFRPTYLFRLIEPFGEFSPMGVLWSFMGVSKVYTIFSGAAEVAGGLLLLLRRTTTFGALVSSAVLLNIAFLNFCYDVPVKLYSLHLLSMALFLLAPDLRRLFDVLVRNRPVAAADLSAPAFSSRRARIAAFTVQVTFLSYVFFQQISGGWKGYRNAYVDTPRPPLYGLYEVETFTRNGRIVPPLVTEAERWRKVVIEFPSGVFVRKMDDSRLGFGAEYDTEKSTVTLAPDGDKNRATVFAYSRPDADHVLLESDTLSLRLKRIDTSKFLLMSRGFHWIQEQPFNR
jgi:uncharacterized membrane protein YphA (DoxX/SURF4 family)